MKTHRIERRRNISTGLGRTLVLTIRHRLIRAMVWLFAVGYRLLRVVEWLISCTRTGKATFIPAAELPWTNELEANWSSVRAESESVLTNLAAVPNYQELSKAQELLTQDDRWKSFLLYVAPHPIEKNCARCPVTAKLLEKVPGLLFAMFSILDGPKHIPPHRGPYKGLLNCHLPLLVPGDGRACRIRVGNDVACWEEGHMLVFDDTHEHEAWNDTDSIRVVLLFYVTRPLPFPLSVLNGIVMRIIRRSPFLRDFARKQNRWFERGEAR